MTPEDIREIVVIVLDEIKKRSQPNYNDILKILEPELRAYFSISDDSRVYISEYFTYFKRDKYIDIIYYIYRDNLTIEKIAELIDKEVSTIKRNKKRLIMELWDQFYNVL